MGIGPTGEVKSEKEEEEKEEEQHIKLKLAMLSTSFFSLGI